MRGSVHSPVITAVICAHNEAGFLEDAVDSLMGQSLPAFEREVLVIDNASTDGSDAVLAKLGRRHGRRRLRTVREERLGLCHARNRALAEASAPLVALIDADAVADPRWLDAIVRTFARGPEIGAVGGPIRIRWDHPTPRWWTDRLAEALNEYRPAEQSVQLHYPRYPYGTNLAVRVDAAQAAGGFDPRLDRQGRHLLAGGDGELCLRLEKAGWTTWYEPQALVHHRTTANRLRRRYIFRSAFHHGRSQYLIEHRHGFESGRYLSWPGIAGHLVSALGRGRLDLPCVKFILFRAGYHWQRTFTRPSGRRRSGQVPFVQPGCG